MFKSMPIMVVENEKADILVLKRVFRDIGLVYPVEFVSDGIEAIRYLENNVDSIPFLIFLDINIPRMNGFDFLKRIRKHDIFQWIPVVVLSTSTSAEDVMECTRQGCNGYFVKNFDYDLFSEIIQAVVVYWANCRRPSLTLNS